MEQDRPHDEPIPPVGAEYEPPRVERVLTSSDLAREVQYAGQVSFDLADT